MAWLPLLLAACLLGCGEARRSAEEVDFSLARDDKDDCLENAKGWLPDNGVELCRKGEYELVRKQVACVREAFDPIQRADKNFGREDAVLRAAGICSKHGNDPATSLSVARCVAEAHQTNKAANKCDAEAPSTEHSECVSDGRVWLPDKGELLCGQQRYAEARDHIACVRKAYLPLYEKSGLDWEFATSIKQAHEICARHKFDPEASLANTRCLMVAWSLGGKAVDACSDDKMDLPYYTKCLREAKALLKGGEYEECMHEVKMARGAGVRGVTGTGAGLLWMGAVLAWLT